MRFAVIVIFVILFIVSSLLVFINNEKQDIKIGLLYSKTGTMSAEENSIAKMLHFGVEEINKAGGINGRKVAIVEYDGKSDSKEFAKGAQELVSKDIKYIFGCWTSASRKAVKPIIEKNDAVLFYPLQYEGVEQSPNIIYLGATPNQQLNPTITYIKRNLGDKIYIVGSDYIYPRISGIYLNELAKKIKLNIVGESYHILGSEDFSKAIEDIKKLKPDAIINTLNGSSNIEFFKQLYNNGLNSKHTPVFSMSLDESSLRNINQKTSENILDGHFATWNYFNSINTNQNKEFIDKLKKRYDENFTLTNPSYNIYLALQLFKKAMSTSNNYTSKDFITQIRRASLNGLSDIHYIDKVNNHVHKKMRIGKIQADKFEVVWESSALTHPDPYVNFQPKSFWDKKLDQFYKSWDNSWQKTQKGDIDE